jgi:polysaccharide deacetylase 2 family uncharacterized protein YibQ
VTEPARPEPAPAASARTGWRWGLVSFWAAVFIITAGGVAYLQALGPPGQQAAIPASPAPAAAAPPPGPAPAKPLPPADPEMALTGGLDTVPPPHGAPIASPNPALLAASTVDPRWQIPRIAADGATPMQVYAASQLPPPDSAILPPDVPRVAMIIAGLRDDPTLTQQAIALPSEFSLGLSPYGKTVTQEAAAARAAGHETLLLLPMPGLLAGAPEAQNRATLDWALSQFQGYAGVTDAFGPAMGGGFMADPAARAWLLTRIARAGLFYIEGDPNAGTPPFAAGATADIVIDASDGPDDELVKLAALVTDAESQHSALGIMLNPTPEALRDLAEWSDTLVNEDILLVPVSALVQPPDLPLPVNASTQGPP